MDEFLSEYGNFIVMVIMLGGIIGALGVILRLLFEGGLVV